MPDCTSMLHTIYGLFHQTLIFLQSLAFQRLYGVSLSILLYQAFLLFPKFNLVNDSSEPILVFQKVLNAIVTLVISITFSGT